MKRSCTAIAALLLSICAHAAGVRAELYQWVDEQGSVRFSDDPSQVPAEQREDALREAPSAASDESRQWNTVSIAPPKSPQPRPTRVSSASAGNRHVIGVAPGASEIRLIATLDGTLEAPFIADTGASLNTIPRWVATRLGVEIDEDTPSISVVGVGGTAIRAPLVTLGSVQVGSAVVENVEVAVLDTMEIGLLGMPFFNHFKVEFDPSAGTLALTDLEQGSAGGGLYGGMGEASWRERYRQIEQRQEAIAELREKIPSEYETVAESYRRQLDQEEERLARQLELLDEQAQRAGVPVPWRE